MTEKEKAKELVDKYLSTGYFEIGSTNEAKECALIAVDEIIESYRFNISIGWVGAIHVENKEFYEKVKEEINKL